MNKKNVFRRRVAVLLLGAALLGGCASGPNAHPRDPLEPFNRGVSEFNEAVDGAVLKPVATAYRDVAPDLVRTGVSNFFGNLRDVCPPSTPRCSSNPAPRPRTPCAWV